MQALIGLWETSGGFTWAPCTQTGTDDWCRCWWWSTFKSRPHLPRPLARRGLKTLLHSPSWFSSARVFAMIYRGGIAKFNACDGFGVWARTHSVCVWDSDSLPRRRSACCRPEQHFKSRQAAQSTTVSQFSHRQR